jgi:hypothetical protein
MLVALRVAEQRLRAVWEVLDGASTRIGAVALNVSSLGGIREGPGLDVGHVSMQRNQLVPYLRAQDRRPAVECRPAHILGVADREVPPRPMRSK